MMKNIKIFPFLIVLFSFLSCKKESENIFTMFQGVKVTFENRGPHSIVENAIVNDGDSVNIYYTITSDEKDMFRIGIDSTQGNGNVGNRRFSISESDRRSYSGRIRMKMTRDGKTTFRIFALDEKDQFIGDGYTSITVDSRASYTHLTNRKIYLHRWSVLSGDEGETLEMTGERQTFFSLTTGKSYNYQEAAANSGDIDFGIYFRVDQSETNFGRVVYNIYSINSPVNPLPELDISGWEKRNTLFSNPIAGASTIFIQNLVSGSSIVQRAEATSINLLYTEFDEVGKGFEAGSLTYFLTPEGKYGAIYVNQLSRDEIGEYFNVSVKMQN